MKDAVHERLQKYLGSSRDIILLTFFITSTPYLRVVVVVVVVISLNC